MLTNIQLSFGYDIGMFYSCNYPLEGVGVEKAGRARFVAGDLKEWEYGWISKLSQHKRERFPSLVTVSLQERTRQVMSLYKSEKWVPPASVENAYREASIYLGVLVRKDHGT